MRAIFGAMLARSIAQTGSHGRRDGTWLRKLDANTKEYVLNPGDALPEARARRKGVITLYDMPDIATLEARTKIPVEYVIPDERHAAARGCDRDREGDEASGGGEAVLRVRHDARGAQRMAAVEIPAHSRAHRHPADSLPDVVRDAQTKIKPMPVDRALLADSLDEWMKYWDANIRNSQRGK